MIADLMEGDISYKLDGIWDGQAENRTEGFPLLIRLMLWLQALQDNASLTLKPARAQDHGCPGSGTLCTALVLYLPILG